MNTGSRMADDAAHRATQDCLPWLLNGTLGDAERDAAQSHLRNCAACRADLGALRRLREAAHPADPECDPDRAFAQLQVRLDAAGPATQGQGGAAWSWLAATRRAANDARWLRRAALAQAGVIVLLAALLSAVLGWPGQADGAWRALGAAPQAEQQAVVVFRPDTPERELRRVVRASGARIVGGPTVTDAYVLAAPAGQAAAALARLRAEPAVLLAEPLASRGAR